MVMELHANQSASYCRCCKHIHRCLLAGWLSDVTGDYDMTFCVAGAVVLLSGIMLFLVPYVRKFDRTAGLPDVSVQIVHSTSKDNATTPDSVECRQQYV